MKTLNKFLSDNTPQMRLLRTIVQGILSVLITNLAMILSHTPLSPEWQTVLVALIMAILSPIMACITPDKLDNEEIKDE